VTPARAFLFSLESIGIKLGLEQIRVLLEALDRPEQAFRSLVVAGTNGKGSVAAMVERGLRAAGYRTGRYTSPHLIDLEERFAIDGAAVGAAALDEAAARVQSASAALPVPPSFFEATTAIALELFRQARVDVAVLEVGLGGRLDATNIVAAEAAAITRIDFDHEQYLGDRLDAIAREKAGVIKPRSLVVLGDNLPVVDAVIADVCAAQEARLVRSTTDVMASLVMTSGRAHLDLVTPRGRYQDLTIALRGRHQVQNALVAVRLLEELSAAGAFSIPAAAIRRAVEDCVWPGRLELLQSGSADVLLDGAHNPAAAAALAAFVTETYGRTLPMVVGIMRDKQMGAMIAAIAPAASHFVFTAASTDRAAPPAALQLLASQIAPGVPSSCVEPARDALAAAQRFGTPVVVAGSLYLVGEIRVDLA
jgi:dihydrofolate synthase/folylpolyglutamate synthase